MSKGEQAVVSGIAVPGIKNEMPLGQVPLAVIVGRLSDT